MHGDVTVGQMRCDRATDRAECRGGILDPDDFASFEPLPRGGVRHMETLGQARLEIERFADEHLPQTGIPLDWERLLSSAFVKSPDYGTRSCTVLCVGSDGWATFDEQTWLPGAKPGERLRYRFMSRAP